MPHKFSVEININVHLATKMLSKDVFDKATFNKVNIFKKSS